MKLFISAMMAMVICGIASAQATPPIAFVGGMLVDGYEAEPIHRATVLVEGNRIIAAGPMDKIELPEGTVTIDASGRTIMPGLIDAHVHVDLIGHGDYDRYYKFLGGLERLDEVMPIAAKQMLRAGVTSAIDLGTPFNIQSLREKIRAGDIPGPRLQVSGPWITRVYYGGVPDEYQVIIKSPEEGRKAVRDLIAKGSDVIKTWVGLTEEDYKAIVEEAHKAGVKVHAHLYRPDAMQAAINAGVDIFQHVGSAKNPRYADSLINDIAHRNIPIVQTISHRIWVYPATVAFPERLYDPVHKEDMPADIYAEMLASFENFHRQPYFDEIGRETRNAEANADQFVKGGAVIGVGTDAASPLNFHTDAMWFEMKALMDIGMTPLQVISAATQTNARIMGKSAELGTIEPGKLADIIIVDGNPLADINAMKHIDIVMKDGQIWYPDPTEDEGLKRVGKRF